MKKLRFIPLLALFCAAAAFAQAGGEPAGTVRTAVQGTVTAVRADAHAREGDVDKTALIVEQKFVPATDFRRTTRLAVGDAWKTATPAQQDQLFEQFQKLLVRTYAAQLVQVRDQDVQFRFKPATVQAGGTDAVVQSNVLNNGDDMQIGYRLGKTPAGWKIYDIDMMGAWLIQVYQRQFSAQVQRGGIDGLIKFLVAHNARAAG